MRRRGDRVRAGLAAARRTVPDALALRTPHTHLNVVCDELLSCSRGKRCSDGEVIGVDHDGAPDAPRNEARKVLYRTP